MKLEVRGIDILLRDYKKQDENFQLKEQFRIAVQARPEMCRGCHSKRNPVGMEGIVQT